MVRQIAKIECILTLIDKKVVGFSRVSTIFHLGHQWDWRWITCCDHHSSEKRGAFKNRCAPKWKIVATLEKPTTFLSMIVNVYSIFGICWTINFYNFHIKITVKIDYCAARISDVSNLQNMAPWAKNRDPWHLEISWPKRAHPGAQCQ